MYVGDIAYAIPQGAHRMKVPLRGSDVRRKFIGDEFQGRVVREVEGATLEISAEAGNFVPLILLDIPQHRKSQNRIFFAVSPVFSPTNF